MQDEEEDRDTSFVSENTDSLYLPTPQRNWVENIKPITMPKKLFVGSLTEVDTFIKMTNEITSSIHGSRPQDKDLQDGVGMTIPTLL